MDFDFSSARENLQRRGRGELLVENVEKIRRQFERRSHWSLLYLSQRPLRELSLRPLR